MWRPVTPSGNRWSRMATSGLDRWSSKTELGLQTALTNGRLSQDSCGSLFVFRFLVCQLFCPIPPPAWTAIWYSGRIQVSMPSAVPVRTITVSFSGDTYRYCPYFPWAK